MNEWMLIGAFAVVMVVLIVGFGWVKSAGRKNDSS